MIYVQSIKYGSLFDSSYFIEDGSFNLDIDLKGYSIGDRFSMMIRVPEWKAWAIKENCIDKHVEVATGKISNDSLLYVYIEFRIVDKRHVVSFSRKSGHLEPVGGPSLYLKPVSWGHEDLFVWLCMGELPTWLDDDEVENYKDRFGGEA